MGAVPLAEIGCINMIFFKWGEPAIACDAVPVQRFRHAVVPLMERGDAVVLIIAAPVLAADGQQMPLPLPGLFDFQGTPEEQAACSQDATKFCSDAIPDTFCVLTCLQQNRTRLRKVCLQVLEVHGQ